MKNTQPEKNKASSLKIPPDINKVVSRVRKFCAFRERSQQEVRDKLYVWGLKGRETEQIIAGLIAEGYLKEERFAVAFARGKFRINKWGKIKIRKGLLLKKVPEPLIRRALAAIDSSEYRIVLKSILVSREKRMRDKKPGYRQKLAGYAILKGFEPELVREILGDDQE